jgi:glutathione S-transferase
MKVYGYPLSTCTRKVLTVLAEKKYTAEFIPIDILKGEQKQPSYLSRHPFGVVPVLEDNGFSLYESRAIIRYLDDKLGGTKLTPQGREDKARMDQWISVEQSYFSGPALQMIKQLYFAPAAGGKPDTTIVAEARPRVERALEVADKALTTHDYLAGTFSLADITWMPYVEYLFASKVGDLVTNRKYLSAWWNRVSERPSWREVSRLGTSK